MKTLHLVSIIAVIGISLVALTFVYQHIQNCEAEGGSISGFFACDKSEYDLISELFHKKYTITGGRVIDGVNGATTELTSTDPHGNSITLLLKVNRNGPYYAEIICKHRDSERVEKITDNIIGYLQNENCFSTLAESDLEYFPITDPCTLSCKERLESMNYTCTELETDSYVCRDEIRPVHEEHIYTYVIPPELGEYYLIPPDVEQKLDSITKVSFHTDNSIQITFDDKSNTNIIIEKNQRFTNYCFESKNIHIWTFTDIVEVSGKQYVEMHKRLAKIPNGFDCNKPIHILGKS